jgi:hypothetical protein
MEIVLLHGPSLFLSRGMYPAKKKDGNDYIKNPVGEKGQRKGKRKIMTKTRRQPKLAAAGYRSQRSSRSRFNYINHDYNTSRSRRRHETNGESKSLRGFAAMSATQRRKIASMGGRSFHRLPRGFAAMTATQRRTVAAEGGRAPHSRPRGFAAMNPRAQRAIAARGGCAPRRGPRGFAAMERRAQRAIAARGGRASHRG